MQGAFNAVMLRGNSIREVILEGPGAGGQETATAVIGDLLAVIGTSGTGFLQHDGYYRELSRLPLAELQSPFYLRFEVDDETGVLAQVAQALGDRGGVGGTGRAALRRGRPHRHPHPPRPRGLGARGGAGGRRARLQPIRAGSAAGARTLGMTTAIDDDRGRDRHRRAPPRANTPRTPSTWISVPAHTIESA